ncbi:MAG TPA: beta-L-arabinofuranosidase domain-containing protein [Opitutaceae bacterium]|jgi:hypothetical protein|nr:beta-L-arabinofuranosidase domain-containing protein [Opitutaceae bacterium]
MNMRVSLALILAGAPALLQSAPVPLQAPPAAAPFSLGDVRLLDSPFKKAMDLNAAYLLSLEPDRLLHNTRLYAGLQPKGELYGGWESMGVAGHTLGHYLTAISQQYIATGDTRFKQRIDYIVSEMAQCQALYGDGYIGALPPVELKTLRDLKLGIVSVKDHSFTSGAWVPWYTEHKILKGLTDAWILGQNAQAKDVAMKLADWVGSVTEHLTPDQVQDMLSVEQGGMLDVMVELYDLTGKQAYLDTSKKFYHKALFDPMADRNDVLPGRHANTQIPKIIGEARTYEVTGDPKARAVAQYFWDLVANKYSFVIGGNSDHEFFFEEDTEGDRLDASTAETCNTYNMLKLTEHVFEWNPKVEYADFYERALYNHILASQEPKKGMFTYFMSLKPGMFKTFSTPVDSFWCCVGTGMENHTKYGEAIYFHGANDLFVNLFIPSELTWKEKGLVLRQETDYPRTGRSTLTVVSAPTGHVTIRVRCPGWAKSPVTFSFNGAKLDVPGTPGTYATLQLELEQGDTIGVDVPMVVRTEAMHTQPTKVAFLYGPLVLAADLGSEPSKDSIPYSADHTSNLKADGVAVPVLVKGPGSLESSLVKDDSKEIAFHSLGIGLPPDMTFRPFWQIYYHRYNVYWDVVTEAEWMNKTAKTPAKS